MTEERPKAPSEMKVEEWKAGDKLYKLARKHHTWEQYLKSIGKENIGVKVDDLDVS